MKRVIIGIRSTSANFGGSDTVVEQMGEIHAKQKAIS